MGLSRHTFTELIFIISSDYNNKLHNISCTHKMPITMRIKYDILVDKVNGLIK